VRYLTVVLRLLLTLLPFVLAGAVTALAAPSAAPFVPGPSAGAPEHAHDGGVLNGTVVGIDYVRGVMSLRAEKKGMLDVYVLPSTNIQGKRTGYYTIADLKKGANVEVFTSVVGSRTNAEIIKLK